MPASKDVVIKDLAGRYTPGRAGWLKLKNLATTEAIIGGVTGTLTRPNTLLLGRLDTAGRLRYVAQTHPLAAAHRHELADLLAPLALHVPTIEHAWPQPLPAKWSGRFHEPQPLPYTRSSRSSSPRYTSTSPSTATTAAFATPPDTYGHEPTYPPRHTRLAARPRT